MRLPVDWLPEEVDRRPPSVDEVPFRSLYRKTQYTVETADRWSLVITRYRPVPQGFHQPLFMEPLLLVHGFSQNRHCWTSGEFVKNLLYFGADIHILELRGHGKSSLEFQRERCQRFRRPLPPDLDYGWDIDSYFLYDLPAAVSAVKRVTRRPRLFYCGHSMGGMLGYGYAGIHDDFEGLITIGSPADLGRGIAALRLLALGTPVLSAAIDMGLAGLNLEERVGHTGRVLLARGASAVNEKLARWLEPKDGPRQRSFHFIPVDDWLKFAERQLARAEDHPVFNNFTTRLNRLSNPARVSSKDVRWLLREGGEREPRKVVEQFARWIRRGEMVCYRTGFDFKRGFSKIHIPMAIIFGDMDPLASVESTRSVYHAAQSEYLLWRPVKGNSHIELTMGHDIRQICYDIKNLIEYARTHRTRKPALPRLR
jgi:pimeloyl-ACP methyl ester carboxylesterase